MPLDAIVLIVVRDVLDRMKVVSGQARCIDRDAHVRSIVTKKRVLFLIDELEVGGAQRQILLLAKALKQAGNHVTVGYFREANAVLRPEFEAAGIEVRLIPKRRRIDPIFVLRLAQFLAEDRDRHVLSFDYTANLWSRLAGSQPISCIRNLAYLPRTTGKIAVVLGGVEHLLSRRSRRVVANSSVTAESVVARGIIPRERLLVIPNAVESEAHAPREEARARLRTLVGGSEPNFIIGTLARLVEPKDLPTLLRAAKLVVDRRPEARFLVGGEGHLRPQLEAQRRELGLSEEHFLLPGTLRGRDVIAGLDIAVLSSSSEGMPNFVLEAMSAGVPVVSTRAGAASELLEEGKLGRLVAIGDHKALAHAILGVMEAQREAQEIAQLAMVKAASMSPADIAAQYLSLFEDG